MTDSLCFRDEINSEFILFEENLSYFKLCEMSKYYVLFIIKINGGKITNIVKYFEYF